MTFYDPKPGDRVACIGNLKDGFAEEVWGTIECESGWDDLMLDGRWWVVKLDILPDDEDHVFPTHRIRPLNVLELIADAAR